MAIPGTGPLVTVTMQGGLCPEGMCNQRVILEADGKVHSAAKPQNDFGVVSAQAMQGLVAAINAADFAALKSKPFTGQCPVAFDGQEYVFEFSTTAGVHRLASCQVEIDWGHPLFVAAGIALGAWVPFPLT